jgi:dihydrofolate synthase/folylpolyglutamate synthase
MITSILEAAGYRPARYMSPHVIDVRERLCAGSRFFDESIYCRAGDEARKIIESINEQKSEFFNDVYGEEPTYFELLTLDFFICARLAQCDIMVLETGMGGRLDCTNVVDPLVSIISLIELEHTKFLGNTIAEIAGEKAGIIKKDKPVLIGKQCPEALEVFIKTANNQRSPLFYMPDIAEISDVEISRAGTKFSVNYKNGDSSLRLSIPVPGAVQAWNAALASAAVKTALPNITDEQIRCGLKEISLPARFELVSDAPPVIIDGAHTPESIEQCVQTFQTLYGGGNVLVFGCAIDKNPLSMAGYLIPHFSKIIITTPGTFKVSDPESVYRNFCSCAENLHITTEALLVKETELAIRQAIDYAREKNLAVLCTGSFYLASLACNFIKENNQSKEARN